MNNHRQYGLIDSLVITRNGNQLKTIEDYAERQLTYTGASDFYDGMTSNNEYSYNANGALVKDLNRKIGNIGYDNLGNICNISFHTANVNSIDYIYAADGTKLRTVHRSLGGLNAYIDSIDYIGNLILKNGQPSMYLFDGGYATFNSNGAVSGWHYYIQDYMGNNRMVVNGNGTTEQITHYYPYGGVIGDISTNENLQKYKFEGPRSHQKEIDNLLARRRAFRRGVELDRTFGLDNYDIHARQYFAMAPMWDRIDPLAEDNPQFSPYNYSFGNPVNYGDYNGMDVWSFDQNGNVVARVRTEDYDKIQIEDKHGKVIAQKEWGYGTIMNEESQTFDVPLEINSGQAGSEIFEFLADNTSVEWTNVKTVDVLGLGQKDFITTSHNIRKEDSGMPLAWELSKSGYTIFEMNHNHPSGSLNPSGMRPDKFRNAKEYGDIRQAELIHKYISKDVQFNVYSKGLYRQYNEWGDYSAPLPKVSFGLKVQLKR